MFVRFFGCSLRSVCRDSIFECWGINWLILWFAIVAPATICFLGVVMFVVIVDMFILFCVEVVVIARSCFVCSVIMVF